jgi:hypothetical protein
VDAPCWTRADAAELKGVKNEEPVDSRNRRTKTDRKAENEEPFSEFISLADSLP